MLKRTIASLILLPLFIFVIYGGTPLYILEMVVVAIALHEFYKAFRAKNMNPIFILGYIFSVYLAAKNIFGLPIWYTYAIIFILFLIGIVHILSGKYDVMDFSVTFLGIFYIGLLFDFIIITMDNFAKGSIYVWIIFVIAFATDTFAYFIGSMIGKHKLIPSISPKKTIEGCVGGILGSAFSCVVFGYIFGLNMTLMFFLGCVGSVIAQLGDLFASSIKRFAGIKDYGKIIPGHGGILDRFDSVLLVAPFVYNAIKFFTN
jgi:phosphatidate cytidylyltransferase